MTIERKEELIEAYAQWLSLYIWTWFGTLTFPGYPSVAKAKRKFNIWIAEMREKVGGRNFRYVAAIEYGAYCDNVHFHVLIGGIRKEHKTWPYRWKAKWQEIAGQAVLSIYDPTQGGIRYLLKALWPDRDFELLIELPHTRDKGHRQKQ